MRFHLPWKQRRLSICWLCAWKLKYDIYISNEILINQKVASYYALQAFLIQRMHYRYWFWWIFLVSNDWYQFKVNHWFIRILAKIYLFSKLDLHFAENHLRAILVDKCISSGCVTLYISTKPGHVQLLYYKQCL